MIAYAILQAQRGNRGMATKGNEPEAINVAQYVRLSTDYQRYSTFHQTTVNEAYAHQRGMRIVRTYADEGKSGLNLAGRAALKQMIADVMTDVANYTAILVYDVSRWGRFQDTDESAYYEFICRQAGVNVHYCAEEFENDGSINAAIVKTLKRAMAGEFSRELSSKVYAGQCHLVTLGFHIGSSAGYGLRRQLVAEDGSHKALLARGERKSLATDRVILVPGPAKEVATVRQIYDLFVNGRRQMSAIAALLHAKGSRTHTGKPWSRDMVRSILINEKYVGDYVFGRTTTKLKQPPTRNPPELWVRADNVFEPIIDRSIFDAAQEIFAGRPWLLSKETYLARLAKLLAANGFLSRAVIDDAPDLPSSSAYKSRFGSMKAVYELVGYDIDRDNRHLETKRRAARIRNDVAAQVCRAMQPYASWKVTTGLAAVVSCGTTTIRVRPARCQVSAAGTMRWRIQQTAQFKEDILLVIRLTHGAHRIRDYCAIPMTKVRRLKILNLAPTDEIFDRYRSDDLGALYTLISEMSVKAPRVGHQEGTGERQQSRKRSKSTRRDSGRFPA